MAKVFVKEFVSRYGICRQILTDQGTKFQSRLFQDVCKLLHIYKKRSTSYHPQTTAIQERFNRRLRICIQMYISKSKILTGTNTYPCTSIQDMFSVHESTHQTPYMMMFGRHTLLAVDLVCPQTRAETEMTGHDYGQSLEGRL